MTEAPISPLRRRMIEDMTMRKFAPRTQEGYIRAVKGFSAFLGASPDTASFEDLRRYQLHLVSTGIGAPTINRRPRASVPFAKTGAADRCSRARFAGVRLRAMRPTQPLTFG
jgi:Phage integrase, N-terminal SAM-like domain